MVKHTNYFVIYCRSGFLNFVTFQIVFTVTINSVVTQKVVETCTILTDNSFSISCQNYEYMNCPEKSSFSYITQISDKIFRMVLEVNINHILQQVKTRIVRESDYSPASQLFLQGEKTITGNYHKLSQARSRQY